LGIGFDIELEDANGLLELVGADESVTQGVELAFIEVVGGRSGAQPSQRACDQALGFGSGDVIRLQQARKF
jgi:hypothetical protein